MKTITLKVFQFSELSDKVKEKVRDRYRVTDITADDFDSDENDILQIAKYLGFQKGTEFKWSGFSCQGDGGQLIGRWYASDINIEALKQHAPVDESLHAIAAEFGALRQPKDEDGELTFITIKSSGRYSHEYAVEIDDENVPEGFDIQAFKAAYQQLCRWGYKQIEAQNDYLRSDEHINDRMADEGNEFFSNGTEWKEQYEQAPNSVSTDES